MKKTIVALCLSILFPLIFFFPSCSPNPASTPDPTDPAIPKTPTWTMTGLLKDWLIGPEDLAVRGQEIFVSGAFENKVAVLDLTGRVQRYYTVEKKQEFDSVSVTVTPQGQVFAASGLGVWELMADGSARKITSFNGSLVHLIAGPDGNLYLSSRVAQQSQIYKVSLTGVMSEYVTVNSSRVSDLAFAPDGELLMADAQLGQILKFSPALGLRVFASNFAPPRGGGAFYMDFDLAGRLFLSSFWTNLAYVTDDGAVISLNASASPLNVTGDLFFANGLLYVLNIFSPQLFEIRLDGTTVLSKRVLTDGAVPWYIDHQGEIITGRRLTLGRARFYKYDPNRPGFYEPNPVLNTLSPNRFTFDGNGNIYGVFANLLKKFDATGREVFRVVVPGTLQLGLPIHYGPADDKIYYYDAKSTSIVRANAQGAETYHRFASAQSFIWLAPTKTGKVYAGVITQTGAAVIDISSPPTEKVVWTISSANLIPQIYIGVDGQGYIYATVGPVFQKAVRIDPADGKAVNLFGTDPGRLDWGFVDPQGFLVTDSGMVVLSAPGLLIKFVPNK